MWDLHTHHVGFNVRQIESKRTQTNKLWVIAYLHIKDWIHRLAPFWLRCTDFYGLDAEAGWLHNWSSPQWQQVEKNSPFTW